jgi:hypothetical protein
MTVKKITIYKLFQNFVMRNFGLDPDPALIRTHLQDSFLGLFRYSIMVYVVRYPITSKI